MRSKRGAPRAGETQAAARVFRLADKDAADREAAEELSLNLDPEVVVFAERFADWWIRRGRHLVER